jgi:hypothetical protein
MPAPASVSRAPSIERIRAMLRRLRHARPAAIVTAGAAVGLFVSHLLSELVPDALAIGACMFAAGALSGLLVGLTYRAAPPPAPHLPLEK